MLPTSMGARFDARLPPLTNVLQGYRPLFIGEAPLIPGAPPFASGTVARAALGKLLGIPEPQLELELELENALTTPQPRRGRGRAFDKAGAGERLKAMLRSGRFDDRDVVFCSWRLSRCAAQLGLPIPCAPATFSEIGQQRTRYAWFAHACDTAGVYARSPERVKAVWRMSGQTRGLEGAKPRGQPALQ